MHLSEMNRLHRVYTIITFGQAGIKSYLPGGQVQNLGGQAAVKSSLPPWASAEEIFTSTPATYRYRPFSVSSKFLQNVSKTRK